MCPIASSAHKARCPPDQLIAASPLPSESRRRRWPQVYALGFVSVFDQILDGFDAEEKEKLFAAYVRSLDEDPAQFRVREAPCCTAA